LPSLHLLKVRSLRQTRSGSLFVALAEDITTKGGSEHYTMRDNVLFEMGLFLGRHGRKNVFLIAPRGLSDAKLQLPTD
jgi:predicted nucleotide-binding protein